MLENKVSFVTGAAQGIGRAAALTLAIYGSDLVVGDLREDALEGTIREIERLGRKGIAIAFDISKKEQVEKAVEKAVEEFGTIDILANCAGIVVSSLLKDLDEDIWDKVMDVNTKGVFLVSQAVSKIMMKNKSGKIVNISSQAGKVGEVGNGVYCASKAAVIMLTQVLALELAPYNVNVNAVCPGYTDTIIMQQVFEKRGPIEGMTPKQYEDKLLTGVPLKRMAKPEEIGELVAFLASDKANYITGVGITIGGGKVLF